MKKVVCVDSEGQDSLKLNKIYFTLDYDLSTNLIYIIDEIQLDWHQQVPKVYRKDRFELLQKNRKQKLEKLYPIRYNKKLKD